MIHPETELYARGSDLHRLTCYDVLRLPRGASGEDVRKAYVEAARRHHPDCNPDDIALATVRFRAIRQAYERLNDPDQRRIYDHELAMQRWTAWGAENDNRIETVTDLFARTRKNLERLMRIMVKQTRQ